MTEDQEIEKLKSALADKMTKHCHDLAWLIAHTSTNESHLLDGIQLASDGIRSMATTIFVEKQKEEGK